LVDWITMSDNRDQLPPGSAVAREVARADIALALDAAARLPEEGPRLGWLQGIAAAAVDTNVQATLPLLARYRGSSEYAYVARQLIMTVAQQDPAEAARMFDGLNDEARGGVAEIVSSEWAQRDPTRAAQWAQAVLPGTLRTLAIGGVASAWAQRELEAALRWTLALPLAERDAALTAVARGAAHAGYIDPRLFQPFSSDEARLQAMQLALLEVNASFPERARAFVAAQTDPSVRAQIERLVRPAVR
jgi:hypothetical protein